MSLPKIAIPVAYLASERAEQASLEQNKVTRTLVNLTLNNSTEASRTKQMVPQRAGRYTDEMTKHHSRTEAGKWNTLHFFFTTDVLVSKCAVKTNHMQERRTLPGLSLIFHPRH